MHTQCTVPWFRYTICYARRSSYCNYLITKSVLPIILCLCPFRTSTKSPCGSSHLAYLKSIISLKLKICPSVMPITCLGLPTSTYQQSNTINPSSSYFKVVTKKVDAVLSLRSAVDWKWKSEKKNSSSIPSKPQHR